MENIKTILCLAILTCLLISPMGQTAEAQAATLVISESDTHQYLVEWNAPDGEHKLVVRYFTLYTRLQGYCRDENDCYVTPDIKYHAQSYDLNSITGSIGIILEPDIGGVARDSPVTFELVSSDNTVVTTESAPMRIPPLLSRDSVAEFTVKQEGSEFVINWQVIGDWKAQLHVEILGDANYGYWEEVPTSGNKVLTRAPKKIELLVNGWRLATLLNQVPPSPTSGGDDQIESPPPSADCVIPPSGPWPPCATGGSAPPPNLPEDYIIPSSGPWPPCATGGNQSTLPENNECALP